MSEQSDVTRLLLAAGNGDASAIDELMPLVYEELRALAGAQMRRERVNHTLQTTALVNEAYLRLVDQDRVEWQGRQHFLSIAAKMMRRVLLNHARAKNTEKRGGGEQRVYLTGDFAPATGDVENRIDLMDLDEALRELEARDDKLGRVVELRFFGGMSMEDIASVLGVDQRTVKRYWKAAKILLYDRLGGESD